MILTKFLVLIGFLCGLAGCTYSYGTVYEKGSFPNQANACTKDTHR